jgi:hypothetical protein
MNSNVPRLTVGFRESNNALTLYDIVSPPHLHWPQEFERVSEQVFEDQFDDPSRYAWVEWIGRGDEIKVMHGDLLAIVHLAPDISLDPREMEALAKAAFHAIDETLDFDAIQVGERKDYPVHVLNLIGFRWSKK